MMPIKFPSDEWIKALSAEINASESYAIAAAAWEGDFIFVVQPDTVFPQTAYLYIDIQHGKSPSAMQPGSLEEKKAKYTISAPFSTWRKVIEGKIDPLQGMFSGKLKVLGSMAQIQRYPRATTEFVACAAKIPTDFGV
jgi:putative sterol carrier protein